jgi:GntR family transcriptional regulator
MNVQWKVTFGGELALSMWFHIDPASGVPIYLQIVQQIRSAVATGVLEEGETLPSVRELAVELAVNPNTVAKAYRELQRDGVISVARGSGTYVSTTPPSVSRTEVAERLRSAARRVAAEAYSLGVSRGELMQVISVASNEVWGVDGKDGDAG